jgi:hypothetical protein
VTDMKTSPSLLSTATSENWSISRRQNEGWSSYLAWSLKLADQTLDEIASRPGALQLLIVIVALNGDEFGLLP